MNEQAEIQARLQDRILVQEHLAREQTPLQPDADETRLLKAEIADLLKQKNAAIVAHYYTDPAIQALAEETGGTVSDSLEMARFGNQHPASTLIVCGVRFMGETAKILNPEKTILMPTLEATCSLDIGCPADEFSAFADQHRDRTVVVYANTSAAVKARADWVVTSSIAVSVVDFLHQRGEKILWAPDRFLGSYVASETGADMLLWQGSCIVHEEFKANALEDMKRMYPDAAVLVHPESPAPVIALADVTGSTSQLIAAARTLPNTHLIVATDAGIFYRMQKEAPEKILIEAPTAGRGATCRSCAHCPWMAMNSLEALRDVLIRQDQVVEVPEAVRQRALIPLQRMLDFRA